MKIIWCVLRELIAFSAAIRRAVEQVRRPRAINVNTVPVYSGLLILFQDQQYICCICDFC